MYEGCPRTLAAYFAEHRETIRHWIDHGTAPEPASEPQLALF